MTDVVAGLHHDLVQVGGGAEAAARVVHECRVRAAVEEHLPVGMLDQVEEVRHVDRRRRNPASNGSNTERSVFSPPQWKANIFTGRALLPFWRCPVSRRKARRFDTAVAASPRRRVGPPPGRRWRRPGVVLMHQPEVLGWRCRQAVTDQFLGHAHGHRPVARRCRAAIRLASACSSLSGHDRG